MNILYCGDKNIEKGLTLSALSLSRHIKEPLCIYVLTMSLWANGRNYAPVSRRGTLLLEQHLQEKNPKSSVRLIDITAEFQQTPPIKNMNTRFTPYCMLRLYADLLPEIPERILYLDSDVLCRRDFSAFYYQNMEKREIAGVLDYYGKWFFRKEPLHFDYLNSGVLLLNMREIRRTRLFRRCRGMCRTRKMFMPDQTALNRLSESKKICEGKYNEQRKLRKDTVFQHFTTSFRFFPLFHMVTVKPWQADRMHNELKLTVYDDILKEYQELITESRKNDRTQENLPT
ncbi:MAG: hypothetical protein LIO86_03035 [Lachnospiraceae bacterium]|nr:hypothetical protein [Lachnospiraceae bacterium]